MTREIAPTPDPVLLSSRGRGWTALDAELRAVPPGRTAVPASERVRVGVHVGRAVRAACGCDGRTQRRWQAHGDVDVVPAGLAGVWEDEAPCTILRLSLSPALVAAAADGLGRGGGRPALAPRFQLRDPRVTHLAWALKAELESDAPAGALYAESVGLALAARLLHADGPGGPSAVPRGGLGARQRQRVLDYIEAHLDGDLRLPALAAVAGLGVSQFTLVFKRSMQLPVHAYVMRRRVERARALLAAGRLSTSQVALAAGFADQSHLTRWMRRVLGITPRALVRECGGVGADRAPRPIVPGAG